MRSLSIRCVWVWSLVFALMVLPVGYVSAQSAVAPAESPTSPSAEDAQPQSKDIRVKVRVSGALTLASGGVRIDLWGVDPVSAERTVLDLEARSDLENLIDGKPVVCNLRKRDGNKVRARCVNHAEKDLGLYMIGVGYASVNRDEAYDTLYETPYLEAERRARRDGKGVWNTETPGKNLQNNLDRRISVAVITLVGLVLIGLIGISYYIMRGFGKVVDIQNQSIDLAQKDREIKSREKFVIAAMIDAEIKANKAKIEAFLTVYEETLRDFEDPASTPKYKTSGEVVQRQPILDRGVFDGNTNRMDLLGTQMASDLIHYYARIKSKPDYVELKPDMSMDEAHKIVKSAVDFASKMNQLSDELLSKLHSFITPRSIDRDLED